MQFLSKSNDGEYMATSNNKQTSKKVASDAGKALSNPKSSQKVKEFAATALAQAKPKKK